MMFHIYIPEGICFSAFVAFVARDYTMQFLICVFCCVFVSFLILVCAFVPFVARGYTMQFLICVFCFVLVSFLILMCVCTQESGK
jgi:hypothetical protein